MIYNTPVNNTLYRYNELQLPQTLAKKWNNNFVKKALLIGINYFGTRNELNGCINDKNRYKKIIKEKLNFKDEEIVEISDEISQLNNTIYPTCTNIKNEILKIVNDVNYDKSKKYLIFVSYSGHGASIEDDNNDENDGKDECLVSVDNKLITDDWLKKEFIDKLHYNCIVVFISDSCHSGTILDLKYNLRFDNKYYEENYNGPRVICIGGCQDWQYSNDLFINGEYTGLLSWAFNWFFDYNETFAKNIETITKEIVLFGKKTNRNFDDQIPSLSSNRKYLMYYNFKDIFRILNM